MNISKSVTLIKDLKQSTFIPVYNEELMEEVQKETLGLYQNVQNLLKEINPKNQGRNERLLKQSIPHISTLQYMIQRNKRNMLVYVDHRLNKIMEIFWEYGSVIPKEFMEYMSNDEKLFVQQYKKMINDYESNLPIELDLAKDIEVPTSANIEVRVMRDCGSIITKNGSTLELKKDTIHYVCREDVENLIIQGHLKPTGL